MHTIEEIRAMSPEELDAEYRRLGGQLIKKLLRRALVTATIVTAVSYGADYWMNRKNTTE